MTLNMATISNTAPDPQAAVLRGLNSIQHAKHSVISLNYNFTAHLWPSLQQALYMLDPEVFN